MKPRARKCKIGAEGCRISYEPFSSMQPCCLNMNCSLEVIRLAESKAYDAKTKEMKSARNEASFSHQQELTQKAFNGMIRLLDADQPCSSCGKPAEQYLITAGHFLSCGGFPEIRFDARNCFGQCGGCNSGQQKHFKGDNATTRQKFEATIRRRFGAEHVSWLYSHHKANNYTIDDLKDMRKVFAAEARSLEKGNLPTRDWRALPTDTELG